MADCLKLIPTGYTASFDIHKANYHKPQRFVFRNGIANEEESEEKIPKVCRARELIGNHAFKYDTAPTLKFQAYYREDIGERPKSTARFRKCNVLYFLEDDEIKIYEPTQKNSGLPQGCIVKKGRLSKPDGGYYTLDDLNIGENLLVYGREYRLINCDDFTRRFLTEMGYRVRSPEPDIVDPITEDRNEMNSLRSYRKPKPKTYKSVSFFKYHPKQLRFFGRFEDEKSMFGEKKQVTLYYDLSQDTIRIVEEKIAGLSDARVLLKPTLVPKTYDPCVQIGENSDTTILNLAHDVKNILIGGQYYKLQNPDSALKDGNPVAGNRQKIQYYKDTDLCLGKPLNIFGFKITLHDCDEFTKEFYRTTYGKELVPLPKPREETYHTHKLVYPHEGFGPPEQTIRTNDPFDPIPHNADLLKFFKHDRFGYDVRELKFLARALTEDPFEKDTRFTVCFIMEDDTMIIRTLELKAPNRNVAEKTYLRRMKVSKPQSAYENAGRCFYGSADMFVGSVIHARGKPLKLLEANEYTYNYMEKHCEMFPYSNIKHLMSLCKEWVSPDCESMKLALEGGDPEKNGCLTYEKFRDILYSEMPENLRVYFPEHAMKTLARYYAEEEYIGLDVDDLVGRVQTELYRKRFHSFQDIKLAFEIQDSDKKGNMSPDRVYFVLRSTSLPINRDLLKSFIYKFPKAENKINYKDLVKSLDWIHHPAEYDSGEPHAIQINWERIETVKNMDKIKYNVFLMDVVPS